MVNATWVLATTWVPSTDQTILTDLQPIDCFFIEVKVNSLRIAVVLETSQEGRWHRAQSQVDQLQFLATSSTLCNSDALSKHAR